MISNVDDFLIHGCGRCSKGGTLKCNARIYGDVLVQLRRIILECGLTEELKWSHPCYTLNGANILILGAFNGYATLNFVKGVLLNDAESMLVQQTENSQSSRQIKLTHVQQVIDQEALIKVYIFEAIEVEKAGLIVKMKTTEEFDKPEELLTYFKENPAYEKAFNVLTPGRQRGYFLHFSRAKQSKTRLSRIEKSTTKVNAGKGFNER